MRILFITYWGINDGLAQSTVLPHVKILSEMDSVQELVLLTVERMKTPEQHFSGFEHIPFVPAKTGINYLDVVSIIPGMVLKTFKLHRKRKFDLVICRGSMAGAVGLGLNRLTDVPYIVESFEPHADYMAGAGEWQKNGPKYLVQKWFEKKIIQTAYRIVTVSENFLEYISTVDPDVPAYSCPCAVDTKTFFPSEDRRKASRKKYGLPEGAFAGIYAGKFDGLYCSAEACVPLFEYFLGLSEKNYVLILSRLSQAQLQLLNASPFANRFILDFVGHGEVPEVLNAADFAYCPVKTTDFSRYCSPIKNGEYWATGLPILITEDIGDDSELIEKEKLGVVLRSLSNPEALKNAYSEIIKLASDPKLKQKCVKTAMEKRSFRAVSIIYADILADLHLEK